MTAFEQGPMDAQLHRRVTSLLADRLDLEVTDVDMDLFETGQLDSLAFVSLLESLELEFGIQIVATDFEVEDFRSVRAIGMFLGRTMPAHEAAASTA